jgi:predicted dehydrogenase
MVMNFPLKIAVVGVGGIGRAHVSALAQQGDGRLCALVDPSEAAQALAQSLGVRHLATLDELLALDVGDAARPDAVVLATPNALHVPQALACIDAGWPVLLEKPISTDVASARQLVEAVERRQARVLIGHHRAHSPIMAKVRQVIEGGALGRLVLVSGSATFYKPDSYFQEAPWRSQPGGGPILINLIHEIHNLRMMCGEVEAVQAMVSHAVRGFAVEDTAVINLRFASGVLGQFVLSDTAASSRSWEQTSQENKTYATDSEEDCYVIAGTHGSLSVPTFRLLTYTRPEDRSWWKPFERSRLDMRREDPLLLQMKHFLQMARGEVLPKVSARDGLANLQVTEAIVEAARSGSTVLVSR